MPDRIPPDSDVPGDWRAPNLHTSRWPGSWVGWPPDPPVSAPTDTPAESQPADEQAPSGDK